MLRIEIENLPFRAALEKLRTVESSDFLVEVTSESPFIENFLAFKILREEMKRIGKKVSFISPDSRLRDFIVGLNEEESFGFVRGFDVALPERKRGAFWRRLVSVKRVSLLRLRESLLPRRLSFFLILGVLSLAVVIYFLFYLLPRAEIVLTVGSEALVKSVEVTASPSAERILENIRVIPAVQISVGAKKSASIEATGSKEIGEKARGEMTIYNKTEQDKSFPAKTALIRGRTQGADLVFLTDADLTVRSQSLEISGVATVSATAEKIGEEYNIPNGGTLTINSYSTNSFIAENVKALSGGSRRLVTVVAEDDQKKLLASTEVELKSLLLTELRNKLVGDQRIEENSIEYLNVSNSYNKKVGEEATDFDLSLEMKADSLSFTEDDLKKLLLALLKSYIPEDYEIYGQDLAVEIISVKSEKGNLVILAKVRTFIVPKIDETRLKNDLLGLSLNQAQEYLNALPSIHSFRIDRFPNWPFYPFLPRRRGAIRLDVTRL